MWKKTLLTFLTFIVLSTSSLTLFASAAKAQWYQEDYNTFIGTVQDGDDSELFGERYTYAQVHWIFYSLISMVIEGLHPEMAACVGGLATGILIEGISACTQVIQDVVNYFINLQADASLPSNNPLAIVSINPISSSVYFKHIASKLHIAKPVYAQTTGYGFNSLEMIFKLWVKVRDIAYSFLIIVMIIMAFMIMFRVKISPQTVITVQSALPKVIMALIFITFSYAIAGLMIDLMYVVIGLIANILFNSHISEAANWQQLFAQLAYSNQVLGLMGAYSIVFLLAAIMTGIVGLGISFLITGGASSIIFVVILITVIIWLVILTFKIFFMLLKTFVNVIFLTLLGPLQILMGTLGGRGFSGWLKSMAIQLAVYPITSLMFFFAFYFLRASLPDDLSRALGSAIWPFHVANLTATDPWRPPLTVGTGATGLLWLATSIVIITLIPKIPEILKSALSGRPFAYGTAVGESFGQSRGYAATQIERRGSLTAASFKDNPSIANPYTRAARAEHTASSLGRLIRGR